MKNDIHSVTPHKPSTEVQKLKNDIAETENAYSGYPVYAAKDDIYIQSKEEQEIDPEQLSEKKVTNTKIRKFTTDDLDVPGSELHDKKEAIGNEDEENNFYSLGGDNHNNLEEDFEE